MPDRRRWLALDVGGANIKAAVTGGQVFVTPFELWKQPERLADELQKIAAPAAPFDHIALTMTAELCDCFESKAEGVRHVLNAVCTIRPAHNVSVWGIDGRFHAVDNVRRVPHIAAAANWLALAIVAAEQVADDCGILIDIGSTTTDLIPLRRGEAVPRGRTDFERLQTGELVYVGVRRTPVCAVAARVRLRGCSTGLCAELFATMQDVYLVLGEIVGDPTDVQTADGRHATRDAALSRLARMVSCDRGELHEADLVELASSIDRRLVGRIVGAARRAIASIGTPRTAVVSGSGAFLARRVAAAIGCANVFSLDVIWGQPASTAACATAMLRIVEQRELGP